MDYQEILERMKKRRDYFDALDFQMIKADYVEMINAMEELLKKLNKEKEKDVKPKE